MCTRQNIERTYPAEHAAQRSVGYDMYQHLCPHGNVIVSPADQLILEENNFDNDVLKGLDFVGHSDCLLTMGVKPTRPDTGYGYIQAHENMEEGRLLV